MNEFEYEIEIDRQNKCIVVYEWKAPRNEASKFEKKYLVSFEWIIKNLKDNIESKEKEKIKDYGETKNMIKEIWESVEDEF